MRGHVLNKHCRQNAGVIVGCWANESTRYARRSVVPVKPDTVITVINRYRAAMADLDKIAVREPTLPNGDPADETEE